MALAGARRVNPNSGELRVFDGPIPEPFMPVPEAARRVLTAAGGDMYGHRALQANRKRERQNRRKGRRLFEARDAYDLRRARPAKDKSESRRAYSTRGQGRMSSGTKSRIARKFVAIDTSAPQRHGSVEAARTCTIRDGGKCELCRRALPDNKKRHMMAVAAVRTSSCAKGAAKGHPRCEGWKFAAGNGNPDRTKNYRGAKPCACPCHSDGRGKPVPTFEEWVARREADEEQHRQFLAARAAAVAPQQEGKGE